MPWSVTDRWIGDISVEQGNKPVKLSLLMIAIMRDESSTMMITITIHNG